MHGLFELDRVEAFCRTDHPLVRARVLTEVDCKGHRFPVWGLTVGTEDPSAPTLGLFGGVHGLERVGTHVVLAWLDTLFARLPWDTGLQAALQHTRLVSVPLANPGGMFLGWRSNPNGVDLMRNAPVDALVHPTPLVGGHRLGPWMPWFRGRAGAGLEAESQALVDFVQAEVFAARSALTLDFHSGFGTADRLWYPYAKTTASFPRVQAARGLAQLLSASHPNHVYQVEPQSVQYTTHGDLWDHLFDQHWARHGPDGPVYVPWTLEMGSWLWVRKNPRQLLSPLGPFNPMLPHRYRRTMRRHLKLVDLLFAAVRHPEAWAHGAVR